MNQQLVIATQECDHCGQSYWPNDHFCSQCGASLVPVAVEPPRRDLIDAPRTAHVATANTSSLSAVLNNRAAVWCVLLVAGPIGLPLLWFSPRFAPWFKVVTTILFFVFTVLLPLAVAYYFLDVWMQPLVDAFENASAPR